MNSRNECWPCQVAVWLPLDGDCATTANQLQVVARGHWLTSSDENGASLSIEPTPTCPKLVLSTRSNQILLCAPITPGSLTFALLPPHANLNEPREQLCISVIGRNMGQLARYVFICRFLSFPSAAKQAASALRQYLLAKSSDPPMPLLIQSHVLDEMPQKFREKAEGLFMDAVAKDPERIGTEFWGREFQRLVSELEVETTWTLMDAKEGSSFS
jgi:hypothetical protein